MNILHRLFVAGLFVFIPLSSFAASAPVGKVLMTVGAVSAKAGDDSRPLQRRSDIFVGDLLVTGNESQMQIRMNDGAMIALAADTEFSVKAYRYNEAGKKDEVVLSVIKGGLRTITGQVEKTGYQLTTPAATLGIRGTIFEVHVAADGTTTVILRQGGVDVTGQIGEKVKMNLVNLASIIKKGGAAGQPGEIPEDVLQFLQSLLPDSAGGMGESDGNGGFNFTIDVDPNDILLNSEDMQPPGTAGDGYPDTDSGAAGCGSNC